MIADRKDFTASLAKRHSEAKGQILAMARLVTGAATVMDKLSRTDEWSRYCTYLQGMIERYRAQRDIALAKLANPAVTEDKDVRKLRQDIFTADVTIDTLRFAVELPAAILLGGDEANTFIADFEKKNENTSGQANS